MTLDMQAAAGEAIRVVGGMERGMHMAEGIDRDSWAPFVLSAGKHYRDLVLGLVRQVQPATATAAGYSDVPLGGLEQVVVPVEMLWDGNRLLPQGLVKAVAGQLW